MEQKSLTLKQQTLQAQYENGTTAQKLRIGQRGIQKWELRARLSFKYLKMNISIN